MGNHRGGDDSKKHPIVETKENAEAGTDEKPEREKKGERKKKRKKSATFPPSKSPCNAPYTIGLNFHPKPFSGGNP